MIESTELAKKLMDVISAEMNLVSKKPEDEADRAERLRVSMEAMGFVSAKLTTLAVLLSHAKKGASAKEVLTEAVSFMGDYIEFYAQQTTGELEEQLDILTQPMSH